MFWPEDRIAFMKAAQAAADALGRAVLCGMCGNYREGMQRIAEAEEKIAVGKAIARAETRRSWPGIADEHLMGDVPRGALPLDDTKSEGES